MIVCFYSVELGNTNAFKINLKKFFRFLYIYILHFFNRPSSSVSLSNHATDTSNITNQLPLDTVNETQSRELQNIYGLEPILQQLEINLNQINMALRGDGDNFNMNILNHVVGLAISTLARPIPDNGQNVIDNAADQLNSDQVRLNTARLENIMIRAPQEEYQDRVISSSN